MRRLSIEPRTRSANRRSWLSCYVLVIALTACRQGTDATLDGGTVLAGNQVSLTVGRPATGDLPSVNVARISIELCAPGNTTLCQTIDDVTVDTGSTGLRVLASALSPALSAALGPVIDASSHPVAECLTFADGYAWGSVKTADLRIGGEQAVALPFQLIADPSVGAAPPQCVSTGAAQQTIGPLGSNAILGVGLYAADCGSTCADDARLGAGFPYYGCAAPGNCVQITRAEVDQIPNPVARFPVDNNGVLIELPAVPDSGASDVTGTLTFGIGTSTKNALGDANRYDVGSETTSGAMRVVFNGKTYPFGVIDSGSFDLAFNDASIPVCAGDPSFYCPSGPLDLTAQVFDATATPHTVSFQLADAVAQLRSNQNALADLASPSPLDDTFFDFGLPFFYGRRVFTAIEGASTPIGQGPYYAF